MPESHPPALGAEIAHPGAEGGGLPQDPIRRARLYTALRFWSRGYTEASDPGFVLSCIHDGLLWTWIKSLDGFQWCGAFAALVDGEGLGMDLAHRSKFYASTFRLTREFPDHRHPGFVARKVTSSADVQPGDLIIVGTPEGKPQGQHITIVVAVDGPEALCIGGNQSGLTSRLEKRREAVALTRYPFPKVRAALSPLWVIDTPAELCSAIVPVSDDLLRKALALIAPAGSGLCITCGRPT